jgi:hypothetical protein
VATACSTASPPISAIDWTIDPANAGSGENSSLPADILGHKFLYSITTQACTAAAASDPSSCGGSQDRKAREGEMAISKRDFLTGAAVAGGALMLERAGAFGQSARRVIDAHTHWYPPEWVELV